jgi:hypothetical protein
MMVIVLSTTTICASMLLHHRSMAASPFGPMPRIGTRFEPFIGLASSMSSLSKGNALSAAKPAGIKQRKPRHRAPNHAERRNASKQEGTIETLQPFDQNRRKRAALWARRSKSNFHPRQAGRAMTEKPHSPDYSLPKAWAG